MRVVDWLAAYVPKMLHVKDVNAMVLWNFHGVRMQNGVKFADAVLKKN